MKRAIMTFPIPVNVPGEPGGSCSFAVRQGLDLPHAWLRCAETIGAHLMEGLKGLMSKHPIVGDIRGRGLMIGIELVRDRQTKERATRERDALVMAAFRRGLLVLGAGASTIRMSPPLVLSSEQAQTAVAILDNALVVISYSLC